MMVTVRFFASYADRIGSKEMRIALSPDASVGDLLQSVARLPGGASLPHNPLVAVNQTYASPDTLLNAGDEIAVIPPVSGGQMRVALVTRALDPQALLSEVADRGRGATALFVGTVRSMSEGHEVTAIEYTAYEAMAIKEMSGILSEAEKRHEGVVLVAEHRIGRVEVGAASIAIAAAHSHRGPALDALRYAIDEIKARVPIWKHELHADGTESWVEPSESPLT